MSSPEFELIRALGPFLDGDSGAVPLGVDDDAAVVLVGSTPVAVAVDAMVDGVHFDRAVSSFEDVGFKALAVNVSDLAAIGARPVAAVIALQRPPGLDDADVIALYRGLREAADRWDVALVGGDTVGSPVLSVSVTVLGGLPGAAALRRDGAQPGDIVLVVGPLGLAAAGLALFRAGASQLLEAHPELLAAHRRPEALPAVGAALATGGASAAIDVSDGLGRDLGHVADQSGVHIRIESARLAIHPGVAAAAEHLDLDPLELVVGGGDDYALVACVPPDRHAQVAAAVRAVGREAHVIGHVERGSGVRLLAGDGRTRDASQLGFQH
ncbi:MAG TPA: thiamine-phosphate kinase [Nitriliruptorales bacterium]